MNINVTEKAQEELKKILDKKGSEGKSVRIYVAGVG
jgi:Fe-S cluster assembly iron-binding protein IscA